MSTRRLPLLSKGLSAAIELGSAVADRDDHCHAGDRPALRLGVGYAGGHQAPDEGLLGGCIWRCTVKQLLGGHCALVGEAERARGITARRHGESAADLIPQAIGFAALGASMAAFSVWVHGGGDLESLLSRSYGAVAAGFR